MASADYTDSTREQAEAERLRASDTLDIVEQALAMAEETAEEIEQEDPQTPEEEADVVRRMDETQRDITDFTQAVADAKDDLSRAIDWWHEVHD